MIECPYCGEEHLKEYLPLKILVIDRGRATTHIHYCTSCYRSFWPETQDAKPSDKTSLSERAEELKKLLKKRKLCPVCERRYIPSTPSKNEAGNKLEKEQHITGACSNPCWNKLSVAKGEL